MPTAAPLSRVNDFVIRFANVNGSGSASANEMFARAVMRMGVPVSPRNIFPSNIQGLPTWYEVRVTEAGHMGARGGTDFMVAMNPQTFDKDIAGIEPGGYLLYDSTKPYPKSKFRDDITVIGVPLTAICNREYTDPRQRQLFKNIIYLGVMSALLDMDVKVIEQLIGEQYKGKDRLIEPNVKALHIGRDYATLNLACPIGLTVRKAEKVGDRIFVEGNAAAALGAVYGGATVCAWYPITPSSSLADAFTRHCAKLRVDPATCRRAVRRARRTGLPHNQARLVFQREIVEVLTRHLVDGMEAVVLTETGEAIDGGSPDGRLGEADLRALAAAGVIVDQDDQARTLLDETDRTALRDALLADPGVQAALDASPKAARFFATLNKANRYSIIVRVQMAKRPETRARKIADYIAMLERGEKIHQ